MMKFSKAGLFILFMGLPVMCQGQDNNWTQFRGSKLDGISNVTSVPLKWSDDSGIIWKTDIHGKGWSSPVIFSDQIWITTATDDGKEMYAVCLDFNSGKVLYDIKVFTPSDVQGKHSLNSYATPTPCIEKGFVYVHYGSSGTACINTTSGAIVWTRTDLKCKHVQGPGSSPVLYKNLLILHYEGTDVRFIIALDKKTGKTVWKKDRPEKPYEPLTVIGRKAYVTPLIINVKGRDMLISNGAAVCNAYDPSTGEEIWSLTGGAESTIAMPFSEKSIVYYYTGYMVDPAGTDYSDLMAINPEGKGDITATNVLWKKRSGRLQLLTPVIKDGLIYTVDSNNNLMCIEAATGKEVWTTRMRSNFNASPVIAAGKIYFFSVRGDVVVIKPGREMQIVSQFQIQNPVWATPAFLRNSIILRTDKYLCKIN